MGADDTLPATPVAVLEAQLQQQVNRYRNIAVFLGALALGVAIAVGVVLVDIARQNQENGRILVDCTTPSAGDEVHVCYERGQENQARAIALIVDEVDRRTCVRMEEALQTALGRPLKLTCPVPRGESSTP